MNSPEKFTFFYTGPFSQWYSCRFVIDGIQYNCAEQYMMVGKAELFDDYNSYDLIMSTSDPYKQKQLGKDVSGFNKEMWENHCKAIVHKGNYAKFTQNPKLKAALLATAGTTLVEASYKDRIWGIGLSENDPRSLDRSTWQGTNWLGEVLTAVRDEIIREDAISLTIEGA